ncbi:MAG: hypothetical protein ACKPFK_11065, partial [Dolichospermum sp.]
MMNVIKKVQNRLLHNSITKVPSLVMGEKLEEIFLKINKKEQHLKSDTLKKCSCHEDFFNFTSQEFGSHQIKSEIIGLLDFVKSYNPQSVCEIGTADGGTNFLLSQAIPSVKLMIGVDLFVKNKFKLS